jgi:effector-binding domain-containing protein
MRLRAMELPLEDIAAVLGDCDDEADILTHLERQKSKLQQRVSEDREIVRSIAGIVAREQEARRLLGVETFPVEEKALEPTLVAGIRVKGKYGDCGEVFARLGRAVGRHIAGKPICLYHDGENRDADADSEPCFPIRREISTEGISIQTLPGGPALALTHRGPYDQLGHSYARILAEARRRSLNILLPTAP